MRTLILVISCKEFISLIDFNPHGGKEPRRKNELGWRARAYTNAQDVKSFNHAI